MDERLRENSIIKISWDRIWISFFTEGVPSDCDLILKNVNTEMSFTLQAGQSNNEYKINITNPGNCQMLPVGIYQLFTRYKNTEYLLEANIDVSKYNRQFVYFHKERAYRVQFSNKDGLKLKTTDVQLQSVSGLRKLSSIIRRGRNDFAKSILRTIYNIEYTIFHRKGTANIHALKNPHILLMSDQSEKMGSNMAALKRGLVKRGYHPDELLRAITTKHYSIFHWIKSLKKIASADYIFLDDHSQTTDWLTIKGAVITQIWHAGAGFKSTGYSRFGMPASPAPKSGHRQYNYGIAGSKKIRHFFSEVWGINDEMVLPTGMPRLDEFLDKDYQKSTIEKLLTSHKELCKLSADGSDIRKRNNIILFAPTYRGENKRHAYYPYNKMDIDRLYKLCQDTDSFIIFKMHPFVQEPVPIKETYLDHMLDLTDYPNINDLFYITDLLITDYSSNIYEFSLMKKPMLFFAFDIDQYSKERGFHRDYRENVPGKIVETFDDMINAIEKQDFEYEKVEKYLSENFEHTDTHACDRIIDQIILGNNKI